MGESQTRDEPINKRNTEEKSEGNLINLYKHKMK